MQNYLFLCVFSVFFLSSDALTTAYTNTFSYKGKYLFMIKQPQALRRDHFWGFITRPLICICTWGCTRGAPGWWRCCNCCSCCCSCCSGWWCWWRCRWWLSGPASSAAAPCSESGHPRSTPAACTPATRLPVIDNHRYIYRYLQTTIYMILQLQIVRDRLSMVPCTGFLQQ